MKTHLILFYNDDYAETYCGLKNTNCIIEGSLDIELTSCKSCKRSFESTKKIHNKYDKKRYLYKN